MFEPWQTAPAMEDTYEKPYPMQEQATPPSFPPGTGMNDAAYGAGAVPYGAQFPGAGYDQYAEYPQTGYTSGGSYPSQAYSDMPSSDASGMAGYGAAAAVQQGGVYDHNAPVDGAYNPAISPVDPSGASLATGAAIGAGAGAGALAGAALVGGASSTHSTGQTGSAAAAAAGLHDGMMVRVKVGFVRSLEDELAINQGQQLYLHTSYDDGWSLCEDDAHNRGVVPLSCLEPWQQ